MTSEWRRVVGLSEEDCQCGATVTDRVGEECPECEQFRCPYMSGPHTDPCGETFDTLEGMKRHHWAVHDECFQKYRHCEYCGDEFPLDDPEQRFCSPDCANARWENKETRYCEWCDGTFDVIPSSDQSFCSPDCHNASRRKRLDRYCLRCGDHFQPIPSRDRDYCGRPCANKHRADGPEERYCQFCGDDFPTYVDQKYCSPTCSAEARADRPDDLTERLHALFVEEGRSVADTSRRVPELGTERIRNRLTEEGWYEKGMSLARQMRRDDVTSVEDIDFSETKVTSN